MLTSVTTKQVSSPYAIYENETKIATIPYEVLRVASQFVSKDYGKYLLMGIHLKVDKKNITVESTDGHRLFTFSTEQLFFIVTCLLKLIRIDKSNFKYNYRIYKLIDKIYLQLIC